MEIALANPPVDVVISRTTVTQFRYRADQGESNDPEKKRNQEASQSRRTHIHKPRVPMKHCSICLVE